jgi:mono/diheme cytochrome c family protein
VSRKLYLPFRNKKQIAFHQPHPDDFGDGGKRTDAGGVGNLRLPAFLILLRFRGSIGVCRWIQYPSSIKPVTTMPAFQLDDRQIDELTAYLETLH